MRALLALILLLVAPAAAFAQRSEDRLQETPGSAEARTDYDQGVAAYAQQDYAAAAAHFRKAYSLEPRRDVLYAWAQTERLRGNCNQALGLYERYLKQDPPRREADIARFQLARCRVLIVPPWYKDAWGDILVASGAVALGVGTAYLLAFVSDENARDAATSRPEYQRLTEDAHSERMLGVIGLSAGAALVTAGIIRYLVRHPGRDEPKVSLDIRPDGAGFLMAGRF